MADTVRHESHFFSEQTSAKKAGSGYTYYGDWEDGWYEENPDVDEFDQAGPADDPDDDELDQRVPTYWNPDGDW